MTSPRYGKIINTLICDYITCKSAEKCVESVVNHSVIWTVTAVMYYEIGSHLIIPADIKGTANH